MKLKVLDQVHISAVQADALRPRQEITVTDDLGDELLARHADKFERLSDDDSEDAGAKKSPAPSNKSAASPKNKAAGAAPAKARRVKAP